MLKGLFRKKNTKTEVYEGLAQKTEMPDKERFQRTLDLFECAISKIQRIARDEKWGEDTLCSRVQKFTDGYLEIIRKELFYDYILRHLSVEEYDKGYPYPFDINVYLETYTTDGASWYKKDDPERKAVGEVSDYRIALIFRILQMQQQK